MNRPRWTLKDAKNKVGTVVTGAIKGMPQHITDGGKPLVVVMSAREYDRLKRSRKQLTSGRRT